MSNDLAIGRVVEIRNDSITVELNRELKSLRRSSIHGQQAIGRINSYVIVPESGRRIVGMVTEVKQSEYTERQGPGEPRFPRPTVRLTAMLVGQLRATSEQSIETGLPESAQQNADGLRYESGLSSFPLLDSEVQLPTIEDLRAILDGDSPPEPTDGSKYKSIAEVPPPGYCIPIGRSVLFDEFNVCFDPDKFFGKHAAILGSTGSGKSCTISSLIQSVHNTANVARSTFIIFDTNGEYHKSFPESRKSPEDLSCRYISSAHGCDECFTIPYWLCNATEFQHLFIASERTQAPILDRALSIARDHAEEENTVLDAILLTLSNIEICFNPENTGQAYHAPGNIFDYTESLVNLMQEESKKHAVERIGIGDKITELINNAHAIADEIRVKKLDAKLIGDLLLVLTSIRRTIDTARSVTGDLLNPDTPAYFDFDDFLSSAMDQAIREQGYTGSLQSVKQHIAPMMLRIRRLMSDSRFAFLLKSRYVDEKAISYFVKDILGIGIDQTEEEAARHSAINVGYYDRVLCSNSVSTSIIVLDFSLISSELLPLVTALLGRIILEFLQRMSEFGVGTEFQPKRGEYPTVLVLDEAQNYIYSHQGRSEEDRNVSRAVFERIAREGRKYGLGLVIASQRPTELSRTVLSQCSSFIVHRLQNPQDIDYIKAIVPGIYKNALDQLPALAPQHAMVLGEGFRAPALVKIRDADPTPQSDDPKFYAYWVAENVHEPDVEAICAEWTGEDVKPAELASADVATPSPVGTTIFEPEPLEHEKKDGAGIEPVEPEMEEPAPVDPNGDSEQPSKLPL